MSLAAGAELMSLAAGTTVRLTRIGSLATQAATSCDDQRTRTPFRAQRTISEGSESGFLGEL